MRFHRGNKLQQQIADLTEQHETLTKLVAALHQMVLPTEACPLDTRAKVGSNPRISQTTRVISYPPGNLVNIGRNVTIYDDADLNGPVEIGDGTFINRSVYVGAQTTIGKRVNIGPFAKLVTDTHEISDQFKRAGANRWPPILIGDGAWIGAGAIILGGVTVGAGSIVAAGAVVTRDVPPDVVVAGVPARVVRELNPLLIGNDESIVHNSQESDAGPVVMLDMA